MAMLSSYFISFGCLPLQFFSAHPQLNSCGFPLFRPSVSPPRLSTRSNKISKAPDSEFPHTSVPLARSIDDKAAAAKPTNIPVPKRTRSPSLLSTNQVFQDNPTAQDDVER